MLFTHLGRVIAIVALLFGIFWIALGVMIGEEFLGPYKDALARYGVKSAGEFVNRGIYTVLVAVPLGILTEISYALRATAKTREQQ